MKTIIRRLYKIYKIIKNKVCLRKIKKKYFCYSNSDLILLIDHNIGGGANKYRQNFVHDIVSAGKIAIILSFDLLIQKYFIEIIDRNSRKLYKLQSVSNLIPLFNDTCLKQIYYNNAVNFIHPLKIIDLMVQLKIIHQCSLVIAVHDYFMLCPSPHLLDYKENYCNIPDSKSCSNCLIKNKNKVLFTSHISIDTWRKEWKKALTIADEITCFSESSVNILKKAYKDIYNDKITVKPHKINTYFHPVKLKQATNLHIGIIGSISLHKGSKIIQQLYEYIVLNKLDIKISIFGNFDYKKYDKNILYVSQEYCNASLTSIIENSIANVFFFPSICSETFSYVCHEMVTMDLPFACFDLGAQADIARSYKKGMVLNSMNSMNSAYILEQLQNLRNQQHNGS